MRNKLRGSKAASAAMAVVVLVIMFAFVLDGVDAKIVRLEWEVKYEYRSPDCYEKLVITINGHSPGPTIFAEQGDIVIVELKNSLPTENTAIHWHGIKQRGTPWNDGTVGVTQCPILPGDTFVYQFVVDHVGTYIYHSHYSMQRSAGLYGMIQVALPNRKTDPFSYDGESSMILADWYHKSVSDQTIGLSSKPFIWVGEPQSLLIQGKGKYNCSLVGSEEKNTTGNGSICNAENTQCSTHAIAVAPGKTYRLRIASLASLSALSFQIEGHNMTVVEADGHYVEPFVINNLYIYSGETYSVLIKADQDPTKNYWMTTNVVSRKPATPIGLAILNYSPNQNSTLPSTIPPSGPIWNDTKPRLAQSQSIKAHHSFITPPPKGSNKTITFLNTQNKIDGYIRWSVNNISFLLPTTPYLIAIKNNINHVFNSTPPPENYSPSNYDIYVPPTNPNASYSDSIYKLRFGSVVDVILQNANTLTSNNSETHPWHLHGHDFWVLGFGEGVFNPVNDTKKFNMEDPIMKNTVPVFPYGWTAIRFIANNPGTWFFHCHIESHMYLGMAVVFAEGVDKVGKLPQQIMGCGSVK